MIKINFFTFFLGALMILGVGSCSHDTAPEMPNLVDRFGPFRAISDLTASQPTADFAAGETISFNATFNKNVAWVLEITGSESGSVKIIEGFSSELNASNSTWDGGTSELPLFKAEMANVVLTVPEETAFIATTTVETLSNKQYEGLLFTDFEQDLGVDAFVGNFEFEFTPQTGRQTDFPAEGDFYYRLEGTDDVVPNFFVGLIDLKSEITGSGVLQFPTTVPEDLFFNFFIFSDAGPHGIAIVDFFIDDNDTGTYELDQDNTTFRRLEGGDIDLATFEGWQQVSYPMSETGISQEELGKVVAIRLLMISNMNAQPTPPIQVGFGIDYMIFTEGGPLEL